MRLWLGKENKAPWVLLGWGCNCQTLSTYPAWYTELRSPILQAYWWVTAPLLILQNIDATPDLVRDPSVYTVGSLVSLKVCFSEFICSCDVSFLGCRIQLLTFRCVHVFGKYTWHLVSCCKCKLLDIKIKV